MNAHAATARAERTQPVHIGDHLREWRQRRHLSQLDLRAMPRYPRGTLSFVENRPRRAVARMVLKLAERLEVPLRERNVLLVAAGFAPAFPHARSTIPRSNRRGRRSTSSARLTSRTRRWPMTGTGIW
jgi:transcriptional regulator with XRE-family HTH domain